MSTDFPWPLRLSGCSAALLVAFLLTACAGPPAARPSAVSAAAPLHALEDEFKALQAENPGRLQAVDAQGSQVRILVFRGGKAPQLGHNHVLSVPRLKGWLWAPPQGLVGARFALAFRLDELLMDAPELRASLGPGWASSLSAEDVVATRVHMLSADNLQADAFPWVHLRSVQISGEVPELAAEVEIELHGQHQRQWVALHVQESAAGSQVHGSLIVRQSDYGIRPYSVLGGLLAVRDELVIDFSLRTQAP